MKKLSVAMLAMVTLFSAAPSMANEKVVKMKKNGWVDVLNVGESKISYQPSTQKKVNGEQQFWAKFTILKDNNPNDALGVNDYTALLGNMNCQAQTFTLLEASRYNAKNQLIETRQAPAQVFPVGNDQVLQALHKGVCGTAKK